MISVSVVYLAFGIAVVLILGICLIGLLRSAGDHYANRLQELLALMGKTPNLERVGIISRKSGWYRIDVIAGSFKGSFTFDPRRWALRYKKGLLDVTYSIRRGHRQEDLDNFFASLNIDDLASTASGSIVSPTPAAEKTLSNIEAS